MTGWDFLTKILTSIAGGAVISFIIGVASVLGGGFLLWKIFRKSIFRWLNEKFANVMNEKLDPIHERLNRHSKAIRELRQKQSQFDTKLEVHKTEQDNMGETIKETVMHDIGRLQKSIDEIRKILMERR